jgi:hypothetical protein
MSLKLIKFSRIDYFKIKFTMIVFLVRLQINTYK